MYKIEPDEQYKILAKKKKSNNNKKLAVHVREISTAFALKVSKRCVPLTNGYSFCAGSSLMLIKTIFMFIVTTTLVLILGKFQIFLKVLMKNFINIEPMNYVKWIVGIHASVYVSDFCIILKREKCPFIRVFIH